MMMYLGKISVYNMFQANCFIIIMCIVLVTSSDTTTDTSKELGKEDVFPQETTPRAPATTDQEETASLAFSHTPGICKNKETWKCYLDTAKKMIQKAETDFLTVGACSNTSEQQGTQQKNQNCPVCNCPPQSVHDCSDLLRMGHTTSGVYTIWVQFRSTENKSIEVYCDMETDGGGWTVIQRRGQFLNPADYFYKNWEDYKVGFGDIRKEFWLGNDNIYKLTNERHYSVRFDLVDFYNEARYAEYKTFSLSDEEQKYALHILDYSGNAGESMISIHHNGKFSTKDQDNDPDSQYHCTGYYNAPWWYYGCWHSNINGINDRNETEKGIIWKNWKDELLASTEIKIRPRNFRP